LVLFVAVVVGVALLVIRARDRKFRHTSQELSAIKRRLHQGLAAPGISIFAVDRTGTVSWFAGRPVPGTRLSMGNAADAESHDLLKSWPEWLEAVRTALRGESTSVAVEVDDSVLNVSCAPLRDDDARVTEALVVVMDNTTGAREAERAERLARMRSRALATINHKLRGQLNGMLGISDLLGTTALDDQQRAWNEVVTDSGHQLLKFVHHLIEFMELDAERFEPLRDAFSLRDTLESVVDEQRERADEDNTALTVRYPLELSEHFSGDREQVQQLLDLLVAVALGTNAGGEVLVNVSEAERDIDESAMVITVEDQGRGLTAESLARVFDGLESPAAMWSIRSGGTGLELPIARLLARAMGGDLTVESRVNIGTTLRVELPLTRATLTELVTKAPLTSHEGHALHVLLVDDSAIQSSVASQLLRQLGHRVTAAHHGAEAIEQLDAGGDFDVMLTELHMPVLDGFNATTAIRERTDELRDLPVIAVTSDTRRATRLEALRHGFDGVIAKPLELMSLRAGLAVVGDRGTGSKDRDGTTIGDPVIDESALARLHELDPGGSDQLVDELITAFLEATPWQILEARDAALALNAAQLDPLVRSITTSCRLLGAQRLEQRTAALLRVTEAQELAAARSAADALTAEFALVRRALTAAIETAAA
jgi:signal transduction histidine kinase/DNA-binding NarL/FixJ family response regulator